MKEHLAFSKAPVLLDLHHQIVLCHKQDTCWGGFYNSAKMPSVYSTTPAYWALSFWVCVCVCVCVSVGLWLFLKRFNPYFSDILMILIVLVSKDNKIMLATIVEDDPKVSLFDSYYNEGVGGGALLLSLDCPTLPLIRTL